MRIIDTHAHIYQPDFEGDVDAVVARAKQAGVVNILLPNIDLESIDRLHKLSDSYAGYCFPMMGLHPTSVSGNWPSDLEFLKAQFAHRNYIAIGEIGIDLYWDKSFEKEQILAFEQQLRWSIEYDLPVAIHSRNATAQCIKSICNIGAENLRGVFHSFGGSEEELTEILALGNFLLGINGVVTFKNSTLPETLKKTDLSHIIIETDAPYLSPVPYRGKRNEPAYTTKMLEKLAEVYHTTPEEVGEQTSENVRKLFGI
ncbi:TatD family hydrolase [Viscerimonas tarda]